MLKRYLKCQENIKKNAKTNIDLFIKWIFVLFLTLMGRLTAKRSKQ